MSAAEIPPPTSLPPLAPVPDPPHGDEPSGVRARLRALRGDGDWIHRVPVRSLLVGAALLVAAIWTARATTGAFRGVEPGHVGVVVNKVRGTVRTVPPGTHFLPRALYDLTAVRVSDQLLTGKAGAFSVSTHDGLAVALSIQARWAIDRTRLDASWAALPPDPAVELVAPVLVSSFRAVAPAYDGAALVAEKRDELAAAAGKRAASLLAGYGIVLRDVTVADVKLPAEVEAGRLALLHGAQELEQKEATLKLKARDIEQTKLEAEAVKARAEKAAETEAAQKLIAAKAESDAMLYILPLKEKLIAQRGLEAEADKAQRLKQAEAEAAAGKIAVEAEAAKRRTLADAEAYAVRTTSLAQFENLKREVELIQANPVWVSKTFAEHISDKVQVILTPQLSSNVFTDEVLKRVANGKPAVARTDPAALTARSTGPDDSDGEARTDGSR